jgi:hypothetical protein
VSNAFDSHPAARGSSHRPRAGAVAALGLAAACVLVAPRARAQDEPAAATAPSARRAALLPTSIAEGAKRAAPSPELAAVARAIDGLLADTAQDLGLVVDLTRRTVPGGRRDDADLAAAAAALGVVVVAPSLEPQGGVDVVVRLALTDPASKALRVRAERTTLDEAPLRAVVMLRDLAAASAPTPAPAPAALGPAAGSPAALATPAISAGRASLLVNATLLGGLAGYSVQRSSGSEDPRLLYPLLAVGAGIGLGASIIVAEEWDVGVGDAWYLAAGAWWPTLAGHLIYEGRFAHPGQPTDERWAFGLVGATTGITLATLGLSLHGMSDGGAMLANSGGALGVVVGGLIDAGVRGDVHQTPFGGMGYGAAFGWLAASAVALHWAPPPSRVLAVDIGAVLGGLGGAALAGPLLFDTPSRLDQRGWLAATGAGALVGAGVAWYWTREPRPREAGGTLAERITAHGAPLLGVLGESVVGTQRAPIVGAGWQGVWH